MPESFVQSRELRLPSLTGLRFVAAFVVLLRHAVPEIFPLPMLLQLSSIGPVGVGFFFVLSGFILTWTWRPERGKGEFYFSRFARIGPLHVLTTVVAVTVLVMSDTPFWLSSLLSLFLLQAWGTEDLRLGGNGPSWSLSVEAFFYICFPLLVRPMARSSVRVCLGLGLVAFIMMSVWTVAYAVGTKTDFTLLTAFSTYTNPLYRSGEFIVGICLGVAMRRGWRLPFSLRSVLILVAAAYVALAFMNWLVGSSNVRFGESDGIPLGVLDLMFLPFTALLVAAAAVADINGESSLLGCPWAVRLGEWSFALYLIQMLTIVPLAALRSSEAISIHNAVLVVLAIAANIALSGLVFWLFEKPMEAALKRSFKRAQRRRHSVAM